MRNQKKDLLAIIIFFLINLILKICFLDKNDISIDEPFSIFHAQMGINQIIKALSQGNNPPLFEIILHYWIKVFGIEVFQVRLLPTILSSFTVIPVYLIGRKFYSLNVALMASTLFTISNFQIGYSHEVRVYSLFILLSSISLFLFLSLSLNKESNKKLYPILLIVINLLLIYAHYFGFFVLLVELIAVISFKDIRVGFLKSYLIYLLIILFLYIPLFAVIIQRFIDSSRGTWVSPPDINSIYNFVWKLSNAPVTTVIILFVLLSASIFWIFKPKEVKVETSTKILLSWFFFPLLFSYIISFILPIFLERYLVYISVSYYLLVAVAISYLKIFKYSWVFISTVIIIAMLIDFNPNYGDTVDWRQIMNKVKKEKTDETIVVIHPAWLDLAFTYYYNTQYFKNYTQTDSLLSRENIFSVTQYYQLDSIKINRAKRILFIDENDAVSPDDFFLKSFRKKFPAFKTFKPNNGPPLYIFTK